MTFLREFQYINECENGRLKKTGLYILQSVIIPIVNKKHPKSIFKYIRNIQNGCDL